MNRFIVCGGQSNMRGAGTASYSGLAPSGVPDASIRFACNNNNQRYTGGLAVDPADSHFGPELQMAKDLQAAGWTGITVAKGSRDGQPLREFLPGGLYYHYMKDAIIRAVRPSATATSFYFVWSQGEAETLEATETNALLWAANYNTLHGIVAGWLGVSPANLAKVICRCHASFRSTIGDATWISTVRAQQASVADALINQDDAVFQLDDTHYAPAWYNTIGGRVATALLAL